MKEPMIICSRCGKEIKSLVEMTDEEIDEVASGIRKKHYCEFCKGVNAAFKVIQKYKLDIAARINDNNNALSFTKIDTINEVLDRVTNVNNKC